ncbi:hypothetical protein, partial [Kluyvera sichuanensis]|uniref:hypothetical protein n=1 Tax=Kluyvera sichuanensis TaxID=2725494 RepID=UPI0039F4649A
ASRSCLSNINLFGGRLAKRRREPHQTLPRSQNHPSPEKYQPLTQKSLHRLPFKRFNYETRTKHKFNKSDEYWSVPE